MARRRLTLLGPDVLLVAMGGAHPNNAALVIECTAPLDARRLAGAVARLLPLAPFMASRLERPRPWGRLRWAAVDEAPPVSARRLGPGEPVEGAVDAVLNEVVDPWRAPPLRWHVIESHDGARAWLILAWVHALMDPRGAELLVGMLDVVDREGEAAARALAGCIEPPADPRDWRTRMRLARRGMPGLQALGRERPRAFGDDVSSRGRVRHRRRLVHGTARTVPVALAAVASAVDELWRGRGVTLDRPFVVPLSVDRRRKGEFGPVFGNYLSFHFARVDHGGADDRSTVAAAIRRDMAEAVRTDAVEALWAGMNLIRYYPPRHLLRPLGGRPLASFHFADTGALRPALPTILGAAVRSAYHAPCVQPHPGLGVFCSRTGELESVVAVWVDDLAREAEIERLLDAVVAGLGAARAA